MWHDVRHIIYIKEVAVGIARRGLAHACPNYSASWKAVQGIVSELILLDINMAERPDTPDLSGKSVLHVRTWAYIY